jgi:acyl-coenzyme A synthetase/AMP-(fatty) acid ligase
MDFAKLIAYQASISPEKPAIAFTGGVATYGVLAGAAAVSMDRAAALGLRSGNLVAVNVRNPFHHATLLLALALQGIASVSAQNSFAIEHTGLKVDAFFHDRFAAPPSGLNAALIDQDWFDHDAKAPPPIAKLLGAPGMPGDDQVLRVVFSSGTTGLPKSVGITNGVLARRFANASFTYGGASLAGSRVMSLMGFSTLPAFMSLFGTLCGGGLVCYAPSSKEALHIIQMFQVNVLSLTPHQLQSLVEAQGAAPPPPSLQTLIVGGSRTPRPLVAEARSRLCSNLMIGYGTTEAGSIAHVHASAVEAIERAAGYVLPWARLEAVDEGGKPVPAGRDGRLRVRSNEMAGYVLGSIENFEPLGDDWFYPGDIGAINEDGMVLIAGRTTELINRGGTIVAPDLVEQVIGASGLVRDCAVLGMMSPGGFEEIWAAVVPDDGYDAQKLLAFCRARLADKTPDQIRAVAELPRNDMGKIMRHRLRDALVAGQSHAPSDRGRTDA